MEAKQNGRRWLSVWLLIAMALTGCFGEDDASNQGSNWVTRHGLTSSAYQTEFDKWVDKGYRLTYVSGHQQSGVDGGREARYNAIWEKTEGVDWYAKHDMSAAQYQAAVDEAERKGFQPVMVDAFNVGSQVVFVAMFEKAQSNWVARHGMTSDEYQQEADVLVDEKGYRIRHVSGYEVEGQARYAAIFDQSPSPNWAARHAMTSDGYQQEFDDLASQGFAPVVIDGFFVNGTEYFTAIWHKADARYGARHQVKNGSGYQKVADDFYYEGYRPVAVDGYGDGSKTLYATSWKNIAWDLNQLDTLNTMIEDFRSDNGIPSISVAIVQDEKLVYANAFGMADLDTNEAATTTHRYRIASLSKALTGAVVTRLIETTPLNLTDQVFGTNGILSAYGNDNVLADQDIASLQLQDVLEHASGGWSNSNGCGAGTQDEPIMFSNNGQSRDWIITNTISNVPLPNTPSTTFCYSNFGYAALEAVIEANNGGINYVDYVKQVLAVPSGANSLEIAGNTEAARLPNEVKYFDNFDPYFWNYARMGGHGGWVITPIDYQRIMTKLDGGNHRADLLGVNGIDIYTRDDVAVAGDAWSNSNFYSKGLVREVNNLAWSHNGNFVGTVAEYIRYDDGFSVMMVINMRRPVGASNDLTIKSLATSLHDASITFPNWDLF